MATNKNQHFVPRCYLKAFTQDSENAAINLLNLDRMRCIPGAPVKNQCSGDYFYGQDAQLEKAIQSVETEYASVVARIQKPGYCLTDNDRFVLRIFILFQYMRTEAASRQSVEMFGGMEMAIGQEIPGFKPSIKEAVQTAMRIFATQMHLIQDLKVCLVRNKTIRPFVTSDNPAAMANRWHMEDQRVQHKSPGLMSCGLTFFLPLTPRVMCVAYDGDVYSFPHKGGWVELHKERDVLAFNEHQFLNAQANVYFREWDDSNWILNSSRTVVNRRLPSRHRTNYAVFDKVDGDHKVFRAVSREDAGDHTEALIHTEMLMPRPSIWPSQLTWRQKGFVYTNGTGAGYIRAEQTKFRTTGGYRREPAKH